MNNLEASSPVHAAVRALAMLQDPNSIATYFRVQEFGRLRGQSVDLEEYRFSLLPREVQQAFKYLQREIHPDIVYGLFTPEGYWVWMTNQLVVPPFPARLDMTLIQRASDRVEGACPRFFFDAERYEAIRRRDRED